MAVPLFFIIPSVFFNVCLAESLLVNVTRSEKDFFAITPWDCSHCAKFWQATCSVSRPRCRCLKDHSTFLVYNKTCVSASEFIRDQSCLTRLQGDVEILDVVDLATSSSTSSYHYPRNLGNCTIRIQRFCFLRREPGWECPDLSGSQVFRVKSGSKDAKGLSIQISGSNNLGLSYSGRILRFDLSCDAFDASKNRSCIIVKAKGTLTARGSPTREQSTTMSKEPGTVVTTTPKQSLITKNLASKTGPIQPLPLTNTSVDLTKINGAVYIDDEDRDHNHEVIVATISVVGTIICVVIICLFTWFIIRYRHRIRRHDETNTPTAPAALDENCQSVIPLSMVTDLSDPLYSDIIESTSKKRYTSSTHSLNAVDQDFFIARNPSQYNTLPKVRQNTDPLPVPPKLRPRPRTPEPRLTYQTHTCAENTNTALFLSQVSRNKCMSLDRLVMKPRERSSTDVDMFDDVFCQDFQVFFERKPTESEKEVSDDDEENEEKQGRTESFYEDLNADRTRKMSIYESLHNATKESLKTRLSTLERINQHSRYDNNGFALQDETEPEYHVLEPLTNHDVASFTSRDNPAFDSRDVSDDEDRAPSPEYHILEGPDSTNQLHYSMKNKDTIPANRRELRKSASDPTFCTLNRFMEICGEEGVKGEKKDSRRQRSQSFHA